MKNKIFRLTSKNREKFPFSFSKIFSSQNFFLKYIFQKRHQYRSRGIAMKKKKIVKTIYIKRIKDKHRYSNSKKSNTKIYKIRLARRRTRLQAVSFRFPRTRLLRPVEFDRRKVRASSTKDTHRLYMERRNNYQSDVG